MKIMTAKIEFVGIYEWGRGFVSHEAAELWRYFWSCNSNGRTDGIYWNYSVKDEFKSTEVRYLYGSHGSIYLHPMGETIVLTSVDSERDFCVQALNEIMERCAEYCGAKYRLTNVRFHEIEII